MARTETGNDSPSPDEGPADRLGAAVADRRELVVRLLRAQEAERHRIASAIHDDPIQVMVASAIRLEMLAEKVSDREIRTALEALRADVTAAIDRLRHVIFELEPAPLSTHGLAAALRALIEELRDDSGPELNFVDGAGADPPEASRTLLYRSARELVVNALKHAQPTRVDIALESEGAEWIVRVRDDGRGFDSVAAAQVRAGHLGLPSMRDWVEQAGGSLVVESASGAGSTVTIRLPAAEREPARRSGS